MTDEIFYTPEEIAAKLKLTKYTVYEIIKRGDLDAHHLGRNIRISESQLKSYFLKSKGSENVFDGIISAEKGDLFANIGSTKIFADTELEGNVKVSIRPEDIILSKGSFVSSARNMHKGIATDFTGDERSVKVIVDIGIPIMALITRRSFAEIGIEKGTELYVVFKTMAVKIYK